MSEDYVRPDGINPDTCGVTLTNYKAYGCKCDACRKLKSEVNRKGRYGLAAEDYERMCLEQNFRCAICGEEKPLHVDHDHVTEEVRGLLCTGCNTGIGKLGDCVEGLQRAIGYLSKTETYRE